MTTTELNEQKRLTVEEIAALWGVQERRVLHFIHTHELRASNLCNGNSRPRWRVTLADLKDFERRRSNQAAEPTPQPRRKRKKDASEVSFA